MLVHRSTILLYLLHGVLAAHNITVDNSDPSITYSGLWTFGAHEFGTTAHFSADDSDAFALLKFTGTAVYYQVHLNPNPNDFTAGVRLAVDGISHDNGGIIIYDGDSLDYTPLTTDVWGITGLTNTSHVLNITRMPEVEFLFVDTLLYTIPDTQDDISTSSSQASSPSSSIVSSSFPSTNKLPIILGTVLGALLLLCIMAVLILYRKTQKLSLIVTGSGTGSTTQLRILTSPLNSPESDEPKPVTLNPLAVFHRNSDAVTPFPLNARPSGPEHAGSQSVLSSSRTGAATLTRAPTGTSNTDDHTSQPRYSKTARNETGAGQNIMATFNDTDGVPTLASRTRQENNALTSITENSNSLVDRELETGSTGQTTLSMGPPAYEDVKHLGQHAQG